MADNFNTPSVNEFAYGGVVDSYAAKYQIPSTVFRDIVRNVSGFDPTSQTPNGSGIANINVKGFDSVNDVGASLDFMAKALTGIYNDVGDWSKVAAQYPGYKDKTPEPEMQYDAMGNATGATSAPDYSNNSTEKSSAGKYIWQYTADDFKALFSKYAYGSMIAIVGTILIIGSVWVLVKTSGEK